MQPDQIKTLFTYHWSITERLLESATNLDDSIYLSERKYGQGSIHELIFHIIAADHGWRIGLETGEQQPGLSRDLYPDAESLTSLLEGERQAWDTYLNQLSEDQLRDNVTLKTLRGHERTFPLWHVLVHLILHGMQHHSELSQVLSEEGQSPGNIDFIFFPS